MVVRTRFRAIVYPILLYLFSGVASFYFVWTAVNGERGLKTKADYTQKIAALRRDLDHLKADHALWDHRIQLMRSEAVDSDLLEEQVRIKLGFTDPRDLVIFTNPLIQR